MRIAVIDDDAKQRKELFSYVEKYFSERGMSYECQTFPWGIDFVSDYSVPYDIIFLDIEMPGMDGLTAAKKIREVDSHVVIIFITRMAQYAIKGYEVNAMDFMIKPVEYFNLSLKLARAVKSVLRRKTFSVVSEGRTIVLSEDDVYYVEGCNQYVVYHTEKENYKVHDTLKNTEQNLSSSFSRCNNSFIVNLNYVSKIDGNDVFVGREILPVSRARKKGFMEDLNKLLGDV